MSKNPKRIDSKLNLNKSKDDRNSGELELHVLVTTHNQWRPDLWQSWDRTSSLSIGFIRTTPNITLFDLRSILITQLKGENLPDQYAYLRHVGRGSTVCSSRQERTLMARDFAPPFYPHPEICILSADDSMIFQPRYIPDQAQFAVNTSLPAIVTNAPSASPTPLNRSMQMYQQSILPPVTPNVRLLQTSAPMQHPSLERAKSPSFRSLQNHTEHGLGQNLNTSNELMMAEINFLEAKKYLADAHARNLRNQYLQQNSVIVENGYDESNPVSEDESEGKTEEERLREEEKRKEEEELRRQEEEEQRERDLVRQAEEALRQQMLLEEEKRRAEEEEMKREEEEKGRFLADIERRREEDRMEEDRREEDRREEDRREEEMIRQEILRERLFADRKMSLREELMREEYERRREELEEERNREEEEEEEILKEEMTRREEMMRREEYEMEEERRIEQEEEANNLHLADLKRKAEGKKKEAAEAERQAEQAKLDQKQKEKKEEEERILKEEERILKEEEEKRKALEEEERQKRIAEQEMKEFAAYEEVLKDEEGSGDDEADEAMKLIDNLTLTPRPWAAMKNSKKVRKIVRVPKVYTEEEQEEVSGEKSEVEYLKAKIMTYRGHRKAMESKHHDLLIRLTEMERDWDEEEALEFESKWRPKCKEEEVRTPQLYERNRLLRLELQMLYKQADTIISKAQAKKSHSTRQGMAFPSLKNNLRINLQKLQAEVADLRKRSATCHIKVEAEKSNREAVEKELKQLRQELINSKISSSVSKR